MLNSFTKGIAKVFGTKAERDLKVLTPFVGLINKEFEKLKDISDDDLRGKTSELKAIIADKLKHIDEQIDALHKEVEDSPDLDINSKEEKFNQIDNLEKDRDEELEKVLIDILPTGFAVVKETARRLTENEKLEVIASTYDKEIAAKKSNVEIKGQLLFGKINGMQQAQKWNGKWFTTMFS